MGFTRSRGGTYFVIYTIRLKIIKYSGYKNNNDTLFIPKLRNVTRVKIERILYIIIAVIEDDN